MRKGSFPQPLTVFIDLCMRIKAKTACIGSCRRPSVTTESVAIIVKCFLRYSSKIGNAKQLCGVTAANLDSTLAQNGDLRWPTCPRAMVGKLFYVLLISVAVRQFAA